MPAPETACLAQDGRKACREEAQAERCRATPRTAVEAEPRFPRPQGSQPPVQGQEPERGRHSRPFQPLRGGILRRGLFRNSGNTPILLCRDG